MLSLLPVFLLLLAAGVVLTLRLRGVNTGVCWLVSVGAALLVWGLTLSLNWWSPAPLLIENWLPGGMSAGSVRFEWDRFSWVFAFSLSSLLLATLLTASVRLLPVSPIIWAGETVVTGVGMLVVLAASPMALILGWTLLDALELGILLANLRGARQTVGETTAFSVRVFGTLLVAVAVVISQAQGQPFTFEQVSAPVALLLLVAAGLRLGVIPLHLPYTDAPLRRGMGTVLRLTISAASLSVLAKVSAATIPAAAKDWLLAFLAIAAVYGAGRWFTAQDELAGRPYFLAVLGSLAVAGAVNGDPQAALVWGSLLVTVGGLLFLFSIRTAGMRLFSGLALLALSGLPFTPAAPAWVGLAGTTWDVVDFIFIATYAVLLAGYARHSLRAENGFGGQERWVWVTYPLGIAVLAGSVYAALYLGLNSPWVLGAWWISAPCAVFAVLLLMADWRLRHSRPETVERMRWAAVVARRVGGFLSALLSLNWLYRLGMGLFGWVQRMVGFFTVILEGDGGVLWTLVLLALLASLVRAGGGG